jgi:hypothetical protein
MGILATPHPPLDKAQATLIGASDQNSYSGTANTMRGHTTWNDSPALCIKLLSTKLKDDTERVRLGQRNPWIIEPHAH